jgi:hypothetical protein
MYERLMNKIVIVTLKKPDRNGKKSFSAKLVDYDNSKLEFVNRSGLSWVFDECDIGCVTEIKI